jgi:hypothetical protein
VGVRIHEEQRGLFHKSYCFGYEKLEELGARLTLRNSTFVLPRVSMVATRL